MNISTCGPHGHHKSMALGFLAAMEEGLVKTWSLYKFVDLTQLHLARLI